MPLAPELWFLAGGVVLLGVHVALQSGLALREQGRGYNAGPRDEPKPLTSALASRAERALRNFQETFPAFAALALAVVVAGRAEGWSAAGAGLWFFARAAYIPLYLAGIPYIRSLVWLASVAGLALMLVGLLAG